VPEPIASKTLAFLDEPLRRVTMEFEEKFVRHRQRPVSKVTDLAARRSGSTS